MNVFPMNSFEEVMVALFILLVIALFINLIKQPPRQFSSLGAVESSEENKDKDVDDGELYGTVRLYFGSDTNPIAEWPEVLQSTVQYASEAGRVLEFDFYNEKQELESVRIEIGEKYFALYVGPDEEYEEGKGTLRIILDGVEVKALEGSTNSDFEETREFFTSKGNYMLVVVGSGYALVTSKALGD